MNCSKCEANWLWTAGAVGNEIGGLGRGALHEDSLYFRLNETEIA